MVAGCYNFVTDNIFFLSNDDTRVCIIEYNFVCYKWRDQSCFHYTEEKCSTHVVV